ncbi:AAA family ATPase [Methylobacterium aquaticum]|jgi:SpoVK/Ycf46/Vps4 family AAA+-type ATPase|uniref:AAA family ATPase n=1 Tax=Methylobacterium aquaticum TaxID=270351 RepID=UPI0009E3AB2A|nr:ATP-binding protein [Methylobacterium aquaticum]
MEHFPIVQALCRAALAQPTPAVRKQIERLRDAIARDGDSKSSAALSSLLTAADRNVEMAPSRITASRMQIPGEVLTRNTPVPVDRETSAPLAELVFPEETNLHGPIFEGSIHKAINSLIEEWNNFDSLAAVGVHPSRSCLVYGSPGTGKTRLAMWMASKLRLPVVSVRIDGLISSFLGTTARNIGNLFAFSNRYRCILLLDEFDAVAKLRDDPQEVGEIKRVVNALLQNLDTRRDIGITIGITNHQNLLDPAVWRRFEVQLHIPKPNFDTRVKIAESFMQPVAAPGTHLKLIAWFTEGATGAEIEAVVRTYKRAAIIKDREGNKLLDTLRQFAILNSARLDSVRRELLFSDPGNLFRALNQDEKLKLSYEDIGDMAGKDKSSISRAVAKI